MKQRLRMLTIDWNDRTNPWAGGSELNVHETFGRLARRGHSVTLLCSRYPGAEPETTLDDMRVVRVGNRYNFNFALPRALRRLHREKPFDVVIENLNKIPLCTSIYSPAPVLARGHHLFGTTVFREVPPPLSAYVWFSELILPWAYRRVPISVVSRSTQGDFAQRGLDPRRMRVIYNGLDPSEYCFDESTAKEEGPSLLALGRVRRYKRLDIIIDAVSALRRGRCPNLTLTIAGSGNYLDALRRQVSKAEAESYVHIVGRVSEEEKVQLYRRAWALVVTSPKEGWGLTCLEAQACGTPVIASDSPGLREAVRHDRSGLLVPHGDTDALVAALDRFLSEETLRRRLQQGALDFASTFSWDRCADETMDWIEESLQGP